MARWSCRTIRGSPPRVREPLIAAASLLINAGITPACAGTTPDHLSPVFRVEDHPRVCGNHRPFQFALPGALGSPPRVREPHRAYHLPPSIMRITPACAGTTGREGIQQIQLQDHPRVCGNHSVFTPAPDPAAGSPPRVREPRLSRGSDRTSGRITPACAGTTKSQFRIDIFTEDHPRVCGNHAPCLLLSACYLGSPPRVREPRLDFFNRHPAHGITPACAGTTPAPMPWKNRYQDHPRVCGNHVHRSGETWLSVGSPPRVREPRRAAVIEKYKNRITPACAGTTGLHPLVLAWL